jgi:hypothetical protein
MSDYDKNGCGNCGTRRRKEGRGGYCNKCSGLLKKLRALERGTYKFRAKCYRESKAPQWRYDQEIKKVEAALKNLKHLEQPLINWTAGPEEIEELLLSIVNAMHLPFRFPVRSYLQATEKNEEVYHCFYSILLVIVEVLPVEKFRTRSDRAWWRR